MGHVFELLKGFCRFPVSVPNKCPKKNVPKKCPKKCPKKVSQKMSQKSVPNKPGPKVRGGLRRSKVLLQLPSTSCRSIILIMITMNIIIMIIMIITIIIMMIIIMMMVMTCPQAPSLNNEYGEQTNWDTEALLIFFEKCTH